MKCYIRKDSGVLMLVLLVCLGRLKSSHCNDIGPANASDYGDNLDDGNNSEAEIDEKNQSVNQLSVFKQSEHSAKKNLGLQRRLALRKSWGRVFEEIRALTVLPKGTTTGNQNELVERKSKANNETQNLLGRWKVKNENNSQQTRRFDGFFDWERKVQRWTERATEYFQLENSSSVQKKKEQKEKQRVSLTYSVPFHPSPAKPDEPVLPHTNIADKSKRIWIVTTATLPWMTGTAVNPLLRAAHLLKGRKEVGGDVTIMVPWLETQEDQLKVYGNNNPTFQTQETQETHIREWLKNIANMPEASQHLNIQWYPAWHNALENSVYSKGDITALIPEDQVDICILEEPEHLNWYREAGESWTIKFKHVVGIVHTNYFVYAQEQPAAFIRAPGMKLLCAWMIRAHCHRVIKLSATLGNFASEKELVENVHGVRKSFLDTGEELRKLLISNHIKNHTIFGPDSTPKVYFLGKMLFSKGIVSLMELLKYAEENADLKVKVDMYGGGPDKDRAVGKSLKLGLEMPFHGPIDHIELAKTHKIFVNPSTSEVLCTASAEALAMGKFVVLPSHPSNDFFAQFPNCLPYATKEEFVGNLYYAMTHSPEPLTKEYAYALSWEAATERFQAAGAISIAEAQAYDQAINTSMADVEINLPPLIEDHEKRRKITAGLRLTRSRFRQFRSKLSEEIQQSEVFPKALENKIVSELDKRLDLDLDEVLNSRKLRIKLSPAELDAQLLDLYNSLSQGPGGEAIRNILGGEYSSKQNLKNKRTAEPININNSNPEDEFLDDFIGDNDFVPEEWVKQTLRRNFLSNFDKYTGDNASDMEGKGSNSDSNPNRSTTKMMLTMPGYKAHMNSKYWGVKSSCRYPSNTLILSPRPMLRLKHR